jgi:glucose-1-phosphate cytidylyltransferase
MKVVLFCGGLGMRIRDISESIPKPMVHIGYRPILWHVMKYYAHYGHRDFILCLGYKGDVIKDYFLRYDECISNDFVLSGGGKVVRLLNSDIDNWNITFVDTGLTSNIGQRLKAVEQHLDGEEIFLANYTDGLTNLHLPDYVEYFIKSKKTASFLAVKPSHSFHVVEIDDGLSVRSIRHLTESGIWMNGGFFIFRKEIFDDISNGEELVNEPFGRLIEREELITYKNTGFWAAMDTFKDKQMLDEMFSRGDAPWEVWKRERGR